MKKMILLCALCLFGAGVVFGQAYSDLLYRDWAGLRCEKFATVGLSVVAL